MPDLDFFKVMMPPPHTGPSEATQSGLQVSNWVNAQMLSVTGRHEIVNIVHQVFENQGFIHETSPDLPQLSEE